MKRKVHDERDEERLRKLEEERMGGIELKMEGQVQMEKNEHTKKTYHCHVGGSKSMENMR